MSRFEPRQAFQAISCDRKRLEAEDIIRFLWATRGKDCISEKSAHLLVKFWNESVRRIGFHQGAAEEGSLSLTDFCQLVLPQENPLLRAIAT